MYGFLRTGRTVGGEESSPARVAEAMRNMEEATAEGERACVELEVRLAESNRCTTPPKAHGDRESLRQCGAQREACREHPRDLRAQNTRRPSAFMRLAGKKV